MSSPQITMKISKVAWAQLTRWARPRGLKVAWCLTQAVDRWVREQETIEREHPRLPPQVRGALRDAPEAPNA